MDLPSIYRFKGWDIRYKVTKSEISTASTESKEKCVVFVHGMPWSSAVFRPIVDALLTKGPYKILVYDLPGYGKSQEYNESKGSATSDKGFQGDTSVKFQAEALSGLLKHEELDGKDGHPDPAVIAHDIAGTIVLRAHLLHKCEFDTMMLVDANAVLPWGDGFYKLARTEASTFLKLPLNIHEAVVRAVTESACHNPNVLKSSWGDIIAEPWIGTEARQRSFIRQIAQANDGDVAEMLDGNMYERVRCDVKIVWGEEDQWIPREKVEDLMKRLGERVKDLAFIPEAGHLVMLDQPARFAIEVFDWLTRFGSPRSLASS